MKLINIDICENCASEKEKMKGVCFTCNAGFYHYVCKNCLKKLEGGKK